MACAVGAPLQRGASRDSTALSCRTQLRYTEQDTTHSPRSHTSGSTRDLLALWYREWTGLRSTEPKVAGSTPAGCTQENARKPRGFAEPIPPANQESVPNSVLNHPRIAPE